MPDGNLVFLGRHDQLVKVRGYRIDLVVVERAIASCPGVEAACVVPRATPDGYRLAAAVRVEDMRANGPAIERLRVQLHDKLPAYAVPVPLVGIEAFPVTANGKVDRAALGVLLDNHLISQKQSGCTADSNSILPPTGPDPPDGAQVFILARRVADLWGESLNLPQLNVDSEFFDLGGDSILAMRIVSLVRRLGGKATIADIYTHSSPARLAAVAIRSAPGKEPANTRSGRADGDTEAIASLRPTHRWFFERNFPRPDHWNQAVLLSCDIRVDPVALCRAVEELIRHHPVLCSSFTPAGIKRRSGSESRLGLATFSWLSSDEAANEIAARCAELNRSLDLSSGRLFRCHLFRGDETTADRLALIAHHLVVDGISWRILLDELAANYRAALLGLLRTDSHTVEHRNCIAGGSAAPSTGIPRLSPRTARFHARSSPRSFMWALDTEGTSKLCARFGRGRKLEAFLLAAFAVGLASETGKREVFAGF